MRTNTRMLLAALLVGTATAAGCDLDLQDPNRPTEDEVFGSPVGIQQVAIGMQATYADEIRDLIWVTGLVADEIGTGEAVFTDYIELDVGDEITRNYYNTSAFDPWTGHYEVIKLANDVLEAVPDAPVIGEATKSGMLALARLHKAMAIGNLAMLYEAFPVDVGPQNPNPAFVSRQEALQTALQLLEDARQQIQTTPPSTAFYEQILAPGFDLENTIDAMTARYSLMAGEYQQAIDAAERVDLDVLSVYEFSATDPNPLWNLWYNSGNAYQMRPEQRFRLDAEPGDQRVEYWVEEASIPSATGTELDDFARYDTREDFIPVYLPDEMKLIQAEAYARLGQLPQARELINEVRTQCDSAVDEPVACLPALTAAQLPTEEAILDEILEQRFYELYLQGLRYADLRRFDEPLKYEWMPIPQSECDRNTASPCYVEG